MKKFQNFNKTFWIVPARFCCVRPIHFFCMNDLIVTQPCQTISSRKTMRITHI